MGVSCERKSLEFLNFIIVDGQNAEELGDYWVLGLTALGR